ncbi:nucleotide exchange factor GrpE [Candidatus Peribacteria bacterium]|jgi:molecular chaperone GrpE|nr:nucleotide exchange factor GrpE [Candidatus Peribacteria bacterium]MBT4020776.1 nucleotide exchange factor GrpE [Candidatus Peribacteria bacterium]MBT4241056.1 nucleotide exchange factor GrpE [Candidatus Peribacteria bacterium]MBT4474445.1 nucleotide exchange factor GrpE [Candidatus Peribacteria bacterium]
MTSDPKDQKQDGKEEEKEADNFKEVAARAQADLQNFKTRMQKEAQELRKFAAVPFILNLLPVYDDLSRGVDHDEGFKQVLEKLEKVFIDAGLTKMTPMGSAIDPSKHEVVNTAPGEKDIVTEVHQDGFELHGKVVRPAKVQVGDGS